MITGKTSQGYEFTVDPAMLREWKFVKAIRRAESSDKGQRFIGTIDLITLFLGEEQADKLAEEIAAKNDGHASVDAMYQVVIEIFDICKEQNYEIKK